MQVCQLSSGRSRRNFYGLNPIIECLRGLRRLRFKPVWSRPILGCERYAHPGGRYYRCAASCVGRSVAASRRAPAQDLTGWREFQLVGRDHETLAQLRMIVCRAFTPEKCGEGPHRAPNYRARADASLRAPRSGRVPSVLRGATQGVRSGRYPYGCVAINLRRGRGAREVRS